MLNIKIAAVQQSNHSTVEVTILQLLSKLRIAFIENDCYSQDSFDIMLKSIRFLAKWELERAKTFLKQDMHEMIENISEKISINKQFFYFCDLLPLQQKIEPQAISKIIEKLEENIKKEEQDDQAIELKLEILGDFLHQHPNLFDEEQQTKICQLGIQLHNLHSDNQKDPRDLYLITSLLPKSRLTTTLFNEANKLYSFPSSKEQDWLYFFFIQLLLPESREVVVKTLEKEGLESKDMFEDVGINYLPIEQLIDLLSKLEPGLLLQVTKKILCFIQKEEIIKKLFDYCEFDLLFPKLLNTLAHAYRVYPNDQTKFSKLILNTLEIMTKYELLLQESDFELKIQCLCQKINFSQLEHAKEHTENLVKKLQNYQFRDAKQKFNICLEVAESLTNNLSFSL